MRSATVLAPCRPENSDARDCGQPQCLRRRALRRSAYAPDGVDRRRPPCVSRVRLGAARSGRFRRRRGSRRRRRGDRRRRAAPTSGRVARHSASRSGRLRSCSAVGEGAGSAERGAHLEPRGRRLWPSTRGGRGTGVHPKAGALGIGARRPRRLSVPVRWFRLLLWPAGAAVGIAAEWIFFGWDDPRHWVPDLVTGWTLIACGLVAWSRRPESRSGALMAATGFSWFLGNFATAGVAPVDWLGAHVLYVYRGPLIHLLITHPSGRLSSPFDRAAVAVGYAATVVTPVWQSEIATIVLAVLLVAVCARSYVGAVGLARRARLLALRAAAGLGLVLSAGASARLEVPAEHANEPSLLALEATLAAVAGGLLAGLLSPSWGRAVVTDLVVELGESRSGTLRDELGRALGDPSLGVGYWVQSAGAFVDSEGRPFALPEPGSARSVTMIEGDGQPVAALVHDPAVLDDPGLREAVSSAAQLAAANARLQAEVRAQMAELRASRRRPLEAGNQERRRLEQRLHQGAERRLEQLAAELRGTRLSAPSEAAAEHLERVEGQLARTLEELRRLAHG